MKLDYRFVVKLECVCSAVVVLLLNKTEKNTFEMYDLDAYLLLK